MERIAHELSVSIVDFSETFGALGNGLMRSAPEVGVCRAKPQCSKCPVSSACEYYRQNQRQVDKETRSLARVIRKEQRPRERLAKRGAEHLTEEELLAIVLRTGSGGTNAVDLAQKLLHDAGTLNRLDEMSISELSNYPGLGKVKAVTIKAALELGRRLAQGGNAEIAVQFKTSRSIFRYMAPRVAHLKQEVFYVLILNTKNELVRSIELTRGLLNSSMVHPREAFAAAVRERAFSVAFIHNHPSGDPTPSREDCITTKRLVEAGDLVGIRVVDHVIIATESYYSFADEGKLR
jgi:DNA repair protein RadC